MKTETKEEKYFALRTDVLTRDDNKQVKHVSSHESFSAAITEAARLNTPNTKPIKHGKDRTNNTNIC